MKKKPNPLPPEMLEEVARRFRLLGEPARLRLLQLLEAGELSVNELAGRAGGNQANISRHLTALHEVGFLKRRREGLSVYYSIAGTFVFKLCDLVCGNAQSQLRAHLGEAPQSGAAKKKGKAARKA